tara:strand:- start:709 stop:1554 length:846 start_codon:yes stop_codon:yes gene_type:complete
MAIKQVTNKNATIPEKANRADQVSLKNETNRISNEQTSVMPGKDFGKNYSITLKDIDSAVINHIKNIIKPNVSEAGELLQVPVLYGNEERWRNVRGRGVLRDSNGSIILPVIVLRRDSLSMNPNMPLSFDHDVRGKYIQRIRAKSWSKENRYDRFAIQQGKQPVEKRLITGMPDFVDLTYNIVMSTSYIAQMNTLQELFVEHLETYFGESTSYKFLSSLEGSISDATTYEVGEERIIKSELTLGIKGYMIPAFTSNVYGTTAETTVGFTKGSMQIKFSEKS